MRSAIRATARLRQLLIPMSYTNKRGLHNESSGDRKVSLRKLYSTRPSVPSSQTFATERQRPHARLPKRYRNKQYDVQYDVKYDSYGRRYDPRTELKV